MSDKPTKREQMEAMVKEIRAYVHDNCGVLPTEILRQLSNAADALKQWGTFHAAPDDGSEEHAMIDQALEDALGPHGQG